MSQHYILNSLGLGASILGLTMPSIKSLEESSLPSIPVTQSIASTRVGNPLNDNAAFPEFIGGYDWGNAKAIPIQGRATIDGTAIDKVMADSLRRLNLPGAAVSIAQGGKIIYSKGFGYADYRTQLPMTSSTICRIDSISKCITKDAAINLIKQGKLQYETPILPLLKRYNVTPRTSQSGTVDTRLAHITIGQLLDHTSGIANGITGKDVSVFFSDCSTLEQGCSKILSMPLATDPGTKEIYSNWGYALLGCIVAKVSGVTYEQYMHNALLRPYGDSPNAWKLITGKKTDRLNGEADYYVCGAFAKELTSTTYNPALVSTARTWDSTRQDILAGAVGWATTSDALCRYFAVRMPQNYNFTFNGALTGSQSRIKVFPNGLVIACILNSRDQDKETIREVGDLLDQVTATLR